MKKEEFVNFISENIGCSREVAKAVVDIFSDSIYLAIAEGQTVELEDLGHFKTRTITRRKPYNIKQGKIVDANPKRYPCFTPAFGLKLACSN